MRRTCPTCNQEYTNWPISARGTYRGEQRVILCCSWACLRLGLLTQLPEKAPAAV